MTTPLVFDRPYKFRQRQRALLKLDAHDFLIQEVADRMADRFAEIQRAFPLMVDLGSRNGYLAQRLHGKQGIERIIQADHCMGHAELVADEEYLPFGAESVHLITSLLNLHWVNDLPGALIQICKALKPDGLFMGSLFGGQSLHELRDVLMAAEAEVRGGAAMRVSPFVEVKDMGSLLQRAGFDFPVADSEVITVIYDDPMKLLHDLKGMGESNALVKRDTSYLGKATLERFSELYYERYGSEEGVPATFEVITATGWKPV